MPATNHNSSITGTATNSCANVVKKGKPGRMAAFGSMLTEDPIHHKAGMTISALSQQRACNDRLACCGQRHIA